MDAGLPKPQCSHWGAFTVLSRGSGIEIVPHPRDPDPALLLLPCVCFPGRALQLTGGVGELGLDVPYRFAAGLVRALHG